MAETQPCHPDPNQLRSFSLGQLDDEAALASISAHLDTCAECCRTLADVPADTLEALVRAAGTVTLEAPRVEPPAALSSHSRYEIQELLGAGGMGMVYKARHKLMERDVALKVIKARLVEQSSAVERFQREVKAAARLAHPNIVTAHDAEHVGDTHFLVMEFVAGRSLAEEIAARGPLPIAEACDYSRQAALGLQHAHEQGMVHRDIKPANLMVARGPDGQSPATVKILDFGLARLVSELRPNGSLTEDGSVMGTADYMAPEQADDPRRADIRADLYSLGCVLYHLLTGRPPFPRTNFVQTLLAHQTQPPQPLTDFRPDVPPQLARVVETMLAKDPADRYQTPVEVVQALSGAERPCNQSAQAAEAPSVPDVGTAGRGLNMSQRRLAIAAGLALVLLPLVYFFGGTIVRFATNKGQLVVEVDSPSVEVQVVQGRLVVVERTTARKFELKAGAGEIEVYEPASGLKLTTRQFTLTRGRKVIVNVTRDVARAKAVRPTGDDDLAGEWNGSAGDWGTVKVIAGKEGFSGSYSDTTNGYPGRFQFKKSGADAYSGEWWEVGKKRRGSFELEVSRDKRRMIVTWKDDKNPKDHGISNWKRIMVDVQPRSPNDLSGEWNGVFGDWGSVMIMATREGYTGTYSEDGTTDGYPGRFQFKKTGDDAYAGEWWETEKERHGSLELEVHDEGRRIVVRYSTQVGQDAGNSAISIWTRLD